ncbi:P-loop containing nucleoside triphosphate hydrolase protein [Phlegmacium glaucopus]|nr:P-loop containing nucleoside triphosphate hydrolase protein [Phlegmacium glaucopus]
MDSAIQPSSTMPATRGYQQEMLEESLRRNIIIALDTGSGKTHIAVLRLKHEIEQESTKLSWFFAPTVALCEQQKHVIADHIPVSVGIVSGSNEPDQWGDAALWERVLRTHRIIVSTPQVFLDALRHGYISLGRDISLLVFDEAHHALDNHPYNRIMTEFYFDLPRRDQNFQSPLEVRPMILGLTASPIYGGNVIKAFQTIESNLDSKICSPRRHRSELALFVHRPIFRHIVYHQPELPFSTNLASLLSIFNTLDIEHDPYVIDLRDQLKKVATGTADYRRIDQELSTVIQKGNSFTHKGLRDFLRAAQDICSDVGAWAADWFICKVIEKTRHAADPHNNVMSTRKNEEKEYLLNILNRIIISPVSFYADDIAEDSSEKAKALIQCLLMEKAETETHDEAYSTIIFVQRRDAVLALAEVLKCHPLTKDVFRVGTLVGSSDRAYRHSMMDVTRKLVNEPQEDTIADFKIGEKNIIVSTSVAEEGLDIQACCSVIRWDPPPNMASWAQSRGRARKKRSTFTVMFEEGSKHKEDVAKWENLEREMVALYNDPSRDLSLIPNDDQDMGDGDNDMEFQVASTGALITLHSAIAHLANFCAVIPSTSHVDNRPLYDIYPPEFSEGWHSFDGRSQGTPPHTGPYGSSVTLPRTLPLPERQFSVDKIYMTKISAHRHAAYKAYVSLYEAALLNEHLLPITSILEPERNDEVREMLADVERRAGFAQVSMHVDPWAADGDHQDSWFCSKLTLKGLPPLFLCTRSETTLLDFQGGPTLYRQGTPPIHTSLEPLGKIAEDDRLISRARQFTRRIFWALNHSRMTWDNLDFSYLFLPIDDVETEWDLRRSCLANLPASSRTVHLMGNAETIGKQFDYPSDLTIIQKDVGSSRPLKFVRWRYEPLSLEEEKQLREVTYKKLIDVEITYPLLVVESYPPRANFLVPLPLHSLDQPKPDSSNLVTLLPQFSRVTFLSQTEAEYAFLLPSVIWSLSMTLIAHSLRRTLFISSPIFDIPISLLRIAITAPAAGERLNYQRMETLGDTVLKFITGVQLLGEYPLWHEGYLSKQKDHTVSNVRLAKKNIEKGLYRWIIRDNMLVKKWKPKYSTVEEPPLGNMTSVMEEISIDDSSIAKKRKKKNKQNNKSQQLSTKVLADVVESLIGAAYLHGGFSLGYECVKFFDLGLKWEPLPVRIDKVLSRVGVELDHYPPQLGDVERMLGYTFQRKLLLMEALTHASYQRDSQTPSYERMEFLGDSVLDMIVTDFLYHAPGRNYSPGKIHLRRSALVNGHILAYICLRMSLGVDAFMPRPNAEGRIEETVDTNQIYLWKCLLHSSPRVLEDQLNTFTRFHKHREEIQESLATGKIFPWASLTRLQAPKFFGDMIESIIGAIFLDSQGNIPLVRQILYNLGIMPILERVISEDIDVLHPVSRLFLWAQNNDKTIKYVCEREGGRIGCAIMVDEKEEVRVTDLWRGKASEEEVKFAAAEEAIHAFKLRDVNYSLPKKKNPKPKGIKEMNSK